MINLNSFIIKLIIQSLPSTSTLFLFFIVIRLFYLKIENKEIKIKNEILLAIFQLWISFMRTLTMLSEIRITQQGLSIGTSELAGINLKLFRVFNDVRIISFQNGYWPYFWINVIGNLVLFIPFGFFLPLLSNSFSFTRTIFYAFLFSTTIEITQLILPRGSDIDDVWLNCLGAIIGWLSYRFIYMRKQKF